MGAEGCGAWCSTSVCPLVMAVEPWRYSSYIHQGETKQWTEINLNIDKVSVSLRHMQLSKSSGCPSFPSAMPHFTACAWAHTRRHVHTHTFKQYTGGKDMIHAHTHPRIHGSYILSHPKPTSVYLYNVSTS